MTDENTQQPPVAQPPAATPVDSQPPATPTPEAPVEPSAPAAPKTIGFAEKIALIKKKAEYINGKNMDSVAAEEQARKDLNLPPLTEAEKVQSSSKNIFEKVLDFLGLNEKLTAKPTVAAPAPAAPPPAEPVEAPVLPNQPIGMESGESKVEGGNVEPEKVAPVQNPAPTEAAPTEEAPILPQQPQAAAPVESEAEKPQV
jgi:hypothetical protein